jgi:hypothetical protein
MQLQESIPNVFKKLNNRQIRPALINLKENVPNGGPIPSEIWLAVACAIFL